MIFPGPQRFFPGGCGDGTFAVLAGHGAGTRAGQVHASGASSGDEGKEMNLLWDQAPLVAPADFSPFTGVVAAPVEPLDPALQPRASTKPGAVTRPERRNLLELGLAHGDGAAALEAGANAVDAARRGQDRQRGADRPEVDGDGGDDGEAAAAGRSQDAPVAGQRVQAIAALAEEIRTTLAATQRLTAELKEIGVREGELRRQLTALLE